MKARQEDAVRRCWPSAGAHPASPRRPAHLLVAGDCTAGFGGGTLVTTLGAGNRLRIAGRAFVTAERLGRRMLSGDEARGAQPGVAA
jgi:hypothetical protein